MAARFNLLQNSRNTPMDQLETSDIVQGLEGDNTVSVYCSAPTNHMEGNNFALQQWLRKCCIDSHWQYMLSYYRLHTSIIPASVVRTLNTLGQYLIQLLSICNVWDCYVDTAILYNRFHWGRIYYNAWSTGSTKGNKHRNMSKINLAEIEL